MDIFDLDIEEFKNKIDEIFDNMENGTVLFSIFLKKSKIKILF